jgi:murein DD-endopeptidase MepM/ murein hydrolase activator NlpD
VDDNIQVKKGQVVTKGQKIAFVGLPAGQTTGWHLHFDVSYSDLLKSRPAHWPNMSTIRALQKANVKPSSARFKKAQAAVMREVVKHYVDPLRFIKDNHS